jgi:hypothetical protein
VNFKQIAVAVDAEGNESLYALSESGRLLVKKSSYTFVPNGLAPRREWRYWWEEVDLPIGDPAANTPVPQEPEIRHLWTDEEVAKLKAEGAISTEPTPASTPGVCVHCNTPTGDESVVCKDCEFPF